MIYLKSIGKKVYLWTHGVTSTKNDLKWKIRKLFYSLSDGLFLYGNNARDIMIQNGYPEDKLTVIYNSLNHSEQIALRKEITSEKVAELRADLFKDPNLPLIVFVGRLTPQKELNVILEVGVILREQGMSINTLFIGDGPERERLENLMLKYELVASTHFYGPCYEERELSLLIGSSDICVSPGEVGLTAITALGYGTPVITHDDFNNQMPEYEAVIPGYNGELFEYNSIDDLVSKIKKWIKNHEHTPREEVRNKCYEIVDKYYNPDYQVKIIEQILLKKNR
jgi:glycosyltransferase involved in cell wall biosynthesis